MNINHIPVEVGKMIPHDFNCKSLKEPEDSSIQVNECNCRHRETVDNVSKFVMRMIQLAKGR